MKSRDECHYGREIADSTEKKNDIKILPNQINVINSGSEADINTKCR